MLNKTPGCKKRQANQKQHYKQAGVTKNFVKLLEWHTIIFSQLSMIGFVTWPP